MAICFENFGAWLNFASKDTQIYFSKDFHARKYFWVFVKERKVLEKFLACNDVLKIQICSGKIEKVEKSKMVKSKYEIHTDLPSQGLVVLSLTSGTFLLL